MHHSAAKFICTYRCIRTCSERPRKQTNPNNTTASEARRLWRQPYQPRHWLHRFSSDGPYFLATMIDGPDRPIPHRRRMFPLQATPPPPSSPALPPVAQDPIHGPELLAEEIDGSLTLSGRPCEGAHLDATTAWATVCI